MCANQDLLVQECIRYIQKLKVPTGMTVEIIVIHDAVSMASGYNEGMAQTDAKYKIYLHQDVLVIEPDFLNYVIGLFRDSPKIGMIGVVGNKSLPEDGTPWSDGDWRRIGELYADKIYMAEHALFSKIYGKLQNAIVVDGLLMATQYDLPWREDLFQGWDCYDTSQSIEFWKAGYQVVVPQMDHPWCLHDNDVLNLEQYEKWRRVFEREYGSFYKNWEGCRDGEYMPEKVIYTRIEGKPEGLKYPYPPVYKEPDAEYLCFTDCKEITSKYWKILYFEKLDEDSLEAVLAQYEQRYELKQNEIQIGSLFCQKMQEYQPVIHVPELTEIPEITFDKTKLIPTRDENGNYCYRKNPVYKGGKYNGRPYLLTIGVPVSNQIETIDRCLSHIKPLLDALDSELVVIDTGSTDGTLDVCRSYGARIVEFPWGDNMSAARNMGIYHAKGEWYLSIDDDEWFEDTEEILKFFQYGTYKRCESASYIQRNYIYKESNLYNDCPACRMARITPELHFEGRIHDALQIPKEGFHCQLFSYANHYGFLRDDTKKHHEKYIRNTQILLYDLYEYPENQRYNFQLANELNNIGYFGEAVAYAFRGISMEQEESDSFYGKCHAACILEILYNASDPRLFSVTELLKDKYMYTDAEKAFMCYIRAELGLRFRHDGEEIIKYYRRYLHFRKRYEKNKEENVKKTFTGLYVCRSENCIMDGHVIAFCAYCMIHDIENAQKELEQIIPEKLYDTQVVFRRYFLQAPDEIFEAAMEKLTAVQSALWCRELLEELLCTLNREEIRGQQILRLAVLLQRFSVRDIEYYFSDIWEKQEQGIKDYLNTYAMTLDAGRCSLQECFFYSEILRREMVKNTDAGKHFEIFLQYVWMTGFFASQYFSPLLLTENKFTAVAGEIRAAYHICQALVDDVHVMERIKHLRRALEAFPGFKNEIQQLLDQMIA